jgi:nucleotide-binding universal stress UspA family protein
MMTQFKRILVPIDGSDSSDRAIDQAIYLAEICDAKIDFIYVANINQLAINACLSDAILEAVTKAGNVILDRALEKVPANIKAEGFSETGSPAVVILDVAENENSDLIVMGSRGLGIVKGVLLGSVSQHLVEQAKCPVMVVK